MLLTDIYKQVRLCFDEEAINDANFDNASAGDSTSMNAIIKEKINDAFHWLCMYAPPELLYESDEASPNHRTGIIVDSSVTPQQLIGIDGGTITLPDDFLRLVRVRANGWHRSVKNPISEYSDEYLQLYDANGAAATSDRPQAAIIEKGQKMLEVFPHSMTANYTYVADIVPTINNGAKYLVPKKAATAFFYYIAFLVLTAYQDPRAENMLGIAKMSIGLS